MPTPVDLQAPQFPSCAFAMGCQLKAMTAVTKNAILLLTLIGSPDRFRHAERDVLNFDSRQTAPWLATVLAGSNVTHGAHVLGVVVGADVVSTLVASLAR